MTTRTLSVGFEIEAVSAEEDRLLEAHIVETIGTLPLPALEELSYGFPAAVPREAVDWSWKAGLDSTIKPKEKAVEIKSPVFLDSPLFSGGWKEEVAQVLTALTAKFGLRTNETAGLHVHVGLKVGAGQAFSLSDIKKIAAVTLLYEHKMDGLHAPHRSEEAESGCLQSNRRNFYLETRSNAIVIQEILSARTIADVQRIINPDPDAKLDDADKLPSTTSRHYKVNFLSLDIYGTVEFRQHAGTVNPAAILAWGDLVLAYVRKALSLSEEEVRKLDPKRQPFVTGILGGDLVAAMVQAAG